MNKGVVPAVRGGLLAPNAEPFVDLGILYGGRVVLSYARSQNWKFTIVGTSAFTVEVRDWPPPGQLAIMTIEWLSNLSGAATWPANWAWTTDANAAPATPAVGKMKVITAMTDDGGITRVRASASAEANI